jgi:hypothetical protein
MQPYGIAKDVLIGFQDSSILVDFMVMDMDPHQQTSIILGKLMWTSTPVIHPHLYIIRFLVRLLGLLHAN